VTVVHSVLCALVVVALETVPATSLVPGVTVVVVVVAVITVVLAGRQTAVVRGVFVVGAEAVVLGVGVGAVVVAGLVALLSSRISTSESLMSSRPSGRVTARTSALGCPGL
jgi:hypothetical protein